MVGVNIGVAAPMAYFPFGGARDSFFGDLKVHGRDAFEFYTDQEGHHVALVATYAGLMEPRVFRPGERQ